jgi:hypothetical protein
VLLCDLLRELRQEVLNGERRRVYHVDEAPEFEETLGQREPAAIARTGAHADAQEPDDHLNFRAQAIADGCPLGVVGGNWYSMRRLGIRDAHLVRGDQGLSVTHSQAVIEDLSVELH